MYGQLILLTEADDGFKNNMYLGIIRQRDGEEMDKTQSQHGYITVYIEHLISEDNTPTTELFNKLEGKKLMLIQSKAFFEAYYHVLKTL